MTLYWREGRYLLGDVLVAISIENSQAIVGPRIMEIGSPMLHVGVYLR